ncbi:MAG: hypothetical protein V1493_02415, partial [Candidatus Diapherotrites archaeon]
MKRITANRTLEQIAFPVSLANVPATVAGLARVVTVDENDFFSEHFCLILNESQELSCTPIPDKAPGFLSCFAFSLHVACPQFFKGNSIAILINDCFRDAVIYISDEPSFSPSQFLQMSFGRTSACSLKASLQMLILPFDFTKFSAIEKSVVGGNCRIVDSPINTNDFLGLFFFWRADFCDYVEEYPPFFGSDSRRVGILKVVFLEVRRDFDRIFLPSIDCAYAGYFGFREKFESVMVEPYRRILLFYGFFFEFEPLEHIAGLVSHSSDKAA